MLALYSKVFDVQYIYMSFEFLRWAREERKNFLVVRIGQREIDFLLFGKENGEMHVLAYGSEEISHFTALQTLERIFARIPHKTSVQELIATFDTSSFRAQSIKLILPPQSPPHRIDKAEAFALERDTRTRAERIFQNLLFKESGILPSEFSLRKMDILERRIDGYAVPRLEGFKGGEIEFSVLVMFLLETALSQVEKFAKARKISRVRVIHIAEALKVFTSKPGREGVYLCMEEEKTRVAVHNEGHFLFLGALPMGAHPFAEFFSDVIGMREPSARLLQQRYFEGTLSEEVREKVHKYLLPETRKFGTLLREKLLEAKTALPESVWIFGRGGVLRDLQDVFSDDMLRDLPFVQRPKTRFLLPKDVWEAGHFPGTQDSLYTELCLIGAFVLNRE